MKVTRRLLCLLLALAMVMTLAPAVAFAEEVTEKAETDWIEATVPAEEPDEEIPETGPVTVEKGFFPDGKERAQLAFADAAAVIIHGEDDLLPPAAEADADLPALGCVQQGVGEEVQQQLFQTIPLTHHRKTVPLLVS